MQASEAISTVLDGIKSSALTVSDLTAIRATLDDVKTSTLSFASILSALNDIKASSVNVVDIKGMSEEIRLVRSALESIIEDLKSKDLRAILSTHTEALVLASRAQVLL